MITIKRFVLILVKHREWQALEHFAHRMAEIERQMGEKPDASEELKLTAESHARWRREKATT
ncbi:MAG: hypothetical protein ACYDAE_23030 [Steroidobacteraceae bacterium]